jgi:hypothetical protein
LKIEPLNRYFLFFPLALAVFIAKGQVVTIKGDKVEVRDVNLKCISSRYQ